MGWSVVGILFLVIGIFGLMAIFVGQVQTRNTTLRNVGIGMVIVSVLMFGLSKVFSSGDDDFNISGVKNSYSADNLGRIVIDGQLENVSDYNDVKLSVDTDGKKAGEDVMAVIKPSKSSFEVSYTEDEKNPVNKLTLNFYVSGRDYHKDITIKEDKSKSTVQSVENAVEKNEQSTEQSTTEASSESQVTLDPEKVKIFESVSKDMVDEFNQEVEKDSLVDVKLDQSKQVIVATLNNKVREDNQDKKANIARELGKRVVGLYRGTVKNSNEETDLPIHVVYQDGKDFGESTASEALTIKVK